jgi:hypothetical protein
VLGALAVGAAQIGARQQVFVHPDRTLEVATPAEQTAQRKVQLAGVGVALHRLDEGVYGLVGLLAEQQVQALEISPGGGAVAAPPLAQVKAAGQPAQGEGQWQRHQHGQQQAGCVEVHAYRPSRGGCSGPNSEAAWLGITVVGDAAAAGGGAWRLATLRWRHQAGTIASTPRVAPAASAASTTMTNGVRHT